MQPKDIGVQARAPETEATTIAWHGECCIASLAERVPELLAASYANGPVTLDMAEISRIDTAGLQLLVVFILDCERRGRPITWRASSSAVDDAAEVTGLRAVLGLSEKS
jgi:anti-anti-sigma regulatory factor